MAISITYFVHGTTTDNENQISSGWKDVELSELGIKQSKELKDQIDINSYDVVFCSNLKRAKDSAKLTFKGKVPIKVDKRLRECNYGEYNGKPSRIVEPLQEKSINKPFANGESYRQVEKRIRAFLEEIKKNYDNKKVAIVAHKAPQLAIEVITNNKTWPQAFQKDWRKTKSWQPGWEYRY